MDITTLSITPELLRHIAEIDEFNGSWRVQNDQNPERLKALRHVATIESIGSSTRIEGSKLSDTEIEKLLNQVGKTHFAGRDEQEVVGYAEVMEMVYGNYEQIQISENYVKQLHTTLLRHSEKDVRHRGEYKKHSNRVEAFAPDGTSLGVVFETTGPFDTPREMQDLINWTKETLEDKAYHPLIVAGIFSVVFLAIHPFQDGNGRLSRVLTSLILLKAGYGYIPYSSMESIIEKNKDRYYLALQHTQKTLKTDNTDWLPWLKFFLDTLKRQKDHLLEKMQTLGIYSSLSHESMLIMQYADSNHRITMKDAEKIITTVSRPTIKNRFSQLVKDGLLVRHGKARGTWYSKPE